MIINTLTLQQAEEEMNLWIERNFIIEDVEYLKKVNRIMGIGHPMVRFYRRVESVCRRMAAGDFSMFKKLKRKKVN